MDLIFPGSNDWGVPALQPEPEAHQPAVDTPCVAWGSVSRSACVGTWAYYVDDYRFEAVWRSPDTPLRSGALGIVEPNWSVFLDTPRAQALWAVYRKRWLAAYWQRTGARVWVDLCVSHQHADLSLMGVPAGWQRYATAGWDGRVADLDIELAQARERAAGAPYTLLVYGGGAATREWCSGRADVVHCSRSADTRNRPGQGTRAKARREAERRIGGPEAPARETPSLGK